MSAGGCHDDDEATLGGHRDTMEAGAYQVEGREISVSPEHIRIWREQPDAAFDVSELRGPAGLSCHSLDIRPAVIET